MNEKMKIYIGQRQRTGLTVWVLSLNIPQVQRIGNKDIDIRDKFSEWINGHVNVKYLCAYLSK